MNRYKLEYIVEKIRQSRYIKTHALYISTDKVEIKLKVDEDDAVLYIEVDEDVYKRFYSQKSETKVEEYEGNRNIRSIEAVVTAVAIQSIENAEKVYRAIHEAMVEPRSTSIDIQTIKDKAEEITNQIRNMKDILGISKIHVKIEINCTSISCVADNSSFQYTVYSFPHRIYKKLDSTFNEYHSVDEDPIEYTKPAYFTDNPYNIPVVLAVVMTRPVYTAINIMKHVEDAIKQDKIETVKIEEI